jgi:hypothetical protein
MNLEMRKFCVLNHRGMMMRLFLKSISLCPIENGELSIIVHKLQNNGENNFCHFALIEEETDMMIEALLKVKNMRSKK